MAIEGLTTIIVLSVIVEVLVEIIKSFSPIFRGTILQLVAAAIGIAICVSASIGILGILGITVKYALLDYILTGIIISRGSHVVHDLIKKITKKEKDDIKKGN